MADSHQAVTSSDQRRESAIGPAGGTLADMLRLRRRSDPEAVAYEFLTADGSVESLTYGELAGRATATAAMLLAAMDTAAEPSISPAGPGRPPALILYPPGLDYVVSLWACLVAGVPAIPAYPPNVRAIDSSLSRLVRLVTDSGAAAILTPPEGLALVAAMPQLKLGGLPMISAATAHDAAGPTAPDESLSAPAADDVAVIQYTSGSTTEPRGVVLTHRNLGHNIAAIRALFDLDRESRGFVWLPPYHDMGLIGGILTPLSVGFPVRLMSPLHFLKHPSTWLAQVSEIGATVSGGPNFAYELLSQKFRGDVEDLDLSRWKVAFNGAEPVRSRTLRAFSARFRSAGFRPESFLPCYGLAEATLLVTGRHWQPADDDGTPVSCGPPVPDHDVVVVDPDSGNPLADGDEGEIWVRGPSVSPGYWRATDRSSADDFLARSGGVPHLRTGDLGVLRNGELFISGRIKDVLIQRGRTFHAVDVEEAATHGDPRVRPVAASFTVQREDGPESCVLVLERAGHVDEEAIARDARARVLEDQGLLLDTVIVAPPRTVPRTSSGKAQRSRCRHRYLSGEYDSWVALGPTRPEVPRPDSGGGAMGADGSPEAALFTQFLTGVFGVVCETDCDEHSSLMDLGGDSLKAAEIAAIVEDSVALGVPVEQVLADPTPHRLARRLLAGWQDRDLAPATIMERLHASAGQVGGQL